MTLKASKQVSKKERYVEAVGRRKTAIARVRWYTAKPDHANEGIQVNGKSFAEYFPLAKQRAVASAPETTLSLSKYYVTVQVEGGGLHAQAEAVRLGTARALVSVNAIWRTKLKALGYLTRDPRMVERKKFGSRKARRPQQWRKR